MDFLLNREAIAFAICFFICCCIFIYFLFVEEKKRILSSHKKFSEKLPHPSIISSHPMITTRDVRYECICELSLKGKQSLGQVEKEYLSKLGAIGGKKIFTFFTSSDDKKKYENKEVSVFFSIVLANKTGYISKEEYSGLKSKAIEFPSKEKKIKLKSYGFYKPRAQKNFNFISGFDCLLELFLRSESHFELEKLRKSMGRLGFIESVPANFCLMSKGSMPYCVAQFGASKNIFKFRLNIALVENPHLKFKEVFDGLRWLTEIDQSEITDRYGSAISESIADKILGEIRKKESILEEMGLKAGSRLCKEIFR